MVYSLRVVNMMKGVMQVCIAQGKVYKVDNTSPSLVDKVMAVRRL